MGIGARLDLGLLEPRDRGSAQMRKRQLLAALLALWALSAVEVDSVGSAAEAPVAHDEWLAEFMAAVTRSAEKGPQWQTHRERIRRDLEDIEYNLMEMSTAAKKADRARAEQANRQVLTLLRRGQEKGYYAPGDVEALVQLLKKG